MTGKSGRFSRASALPFIFMSAFLSKYLPISFSQCSFSSYSEREEERRVATFGYALEPQLSQLPGSYERRSSLEIRSSTTGSPSFGQKKVRTIYDIMRVNLFRVRKLF